MRFSHAIMPIAWLPWSLSYELSGIGQPKMESPCVKICIYEPDRGLCSGCGRTLDEIARWTQMSEEERRRIMAELPARLAQRARQ